MPKKLLTLSQPPERFRIVVGTNSLIGTSQGPYSNHCQMWYRFGRYYTNVDFAFSNPPRMSIDRMRNMTAEYALAVEARYVLFIDDDVLLPLPFDFLKKLIDLDSDIAAGDVIIRGYPFNHMLFRWNKEKSGLLQIPKLPKKRGPYPCDAVGFSCCLIKTELIKKLSKPYFITGAANTEDIYFCLKAREEYPKTTIMADTSVICGHVLWNEVIDSHNKANYSRYWKAQFEKPERSKDKEACFRGNEYRETVRRIVNA